MTDATMPSAGISRVSLKIMAIAVMLAPIWLAAPARAQSIGRGTGPVQPISRDTPVTFTADSVQYDRDGGIVTATGHVEAWQNDHILRADRVTFDRNTNVAAASGHVVMVEPDGQVVFSEYAELTQGMRDGVLKDMRAILAENGRLAANGARRTEGKLNELSRAVYSTCNLCARDPTKPPLWQLRAFSAVQDVENKRIEYEDAVLEMYGIPVFYMPYFSHADPSAKRESGFLVPNIGNDSHLGQFFTAPYYLVLDKDKDVTITPLIADKSGPQVELDYRERFNNGTMKLNGSVGYDEGAPQGHFFGKGTFSYDDTWRYGFDVNVASSANYLRDFHISGFNGNNVLTSQIYAEGFGQGAYSKLEARSYQGLTSAVDDSKLPFVLPRYQYSYFGQPDALGGRLSVDTGFFNVLRRQGTNDERASFSANWERPAIGAFGEIYKATLHVDSEAYNAYDLNAQPNFSNYTNASTARAQPTAAIEVRWPLLRAGGGNSQLLEPIAQLIVSPNTGSSGYRRVPNEDSLAPEFTDANLFALNRFPGIDRQEGGTRANLGFHSALTFGGANIDSLIGQSYRYHNDDTFPSYVGLNSRISDIVARTTIAPASWFDLTFRTRLDHKNFNMHFGEAIAGAGPSWLRVNAGYIYTSYDPTFELDTPPEIAANTPRNEISLGASSKFGPFRLSAYGRRDLQSSKMVSTGADAAYEDECFIFDAKFDRRYTSINNDHGDTLILFTVTLKTVGQFGFHAS